MYYTIFLGFGLVLILLHNLILPPVVFIILVTLVCAA